MKRVRYGLLAGVCVMAMVSGTQADAQVMVQDNAALTQWWTSLADDAKAYALQVQQYATEVKTYVGDELSWTKQAAQYATQVQQYANEVQMFLALAHNPSLGSAMPLLNMAGLGSSMPVNPYAMMQIVNGVSYGAGGLPEIQGVLSGINSLSPQAYTLNHVYSPTDGSWDSQQIIANGNAIAGTQGLAGAAYTDLNTHAAALPALRETLEAAQDTKSVQDAQGEIQLESTWTANQNAKLTAAQLTYEAQHDSRAQQQDEQITKSLDDELAAAKEQGIY